MNIFIKFWHFSLLNIQCKKIILISLIGFTQSRINAQTTDTFYNAINAIDFDCYVEHQNVGAFINALPHGYNTLELVGNLTNNRVSFLSVIYPGGSQLLIRVKKYLFMNPIDSKRVWDLDQFKKERIHYLLLSHWNFQSKDAVGN
jgi:hypothetical protein